jgi:hypothetical protein
LTLIKDIKYIVCIILIKNGGCWRRCGPPSPRPRGTPSNGGCSWTRCSGPEPGGQVDDSMPNLLRGQAH